jgi:hypothetical protein
LLIKATEVGVYGPVVPGLQEAEARGLLEARNLRPAWATQQDFVEIKEERKEGGRKEGRKEGRLCHFPLSLPPSSTQPVLTQFSLSLSLSL